MSARPRSGSAPAGGCEAAAALPEPAGALRAAAGPEEASGVAAAGSLLLQAEAASPSATKAHPRGRWQTRPMASTLEERRGDQERLVASALSTTHIFGLLVIPEHRLTARAVPSLSPTFSRIFARAA